MYAVEFEADAQKDIIKLPKEYHKLNNKRLHVFIIPVDKNFDNTNFEPRNYFGVGSSTKEEVDVYLNSERESWENISYEK